MTEQTSQAVIKFDNGTYRQIICCNHQCIGERFDHVYSFSHLSDLGWRRVVGEEERYLCPNCVSEEGAE